MDQCACSKEKISQNFVAFSEYMNFNVHSKEFAGNHGNHTYKFSPIHTTPSFEPNFHGDETKKVNS